MCKIEFFDDSFNLLSAHMVDVQALGVDYLTFEPSKIYVHGDSKARKGCFCRVSGTISYEGVVSDIQPETSGETVSVRPLQALFDFDVFSTAFEDVAAFILQAVSDSIVTNADKLQNRPLEITNSAPAAPRPIESSGTKLNLLSLISSALKIYGIAVDCKLDLSQKGKKVVAEIKQITATQTVEADKPNVISKKITLGDSYGSVNKIIIRKTEKDIETGIVSVLDTVPFFLHTDGSVSSVNKNRITPVFWTLEELLICDDWNSKALAKATEKLSPQKYDNEIELVLRKGDGIVHPGLMQIGTAVTVFYNKKPYSSILTGKTQQKDTVTLTFGCVRVSLTKKLILERRNNK